MEIPDPHVVGARHADRSNAPPATWFEGQVVEPQLSSKLVSHYVPSCPKVGGHVKVARFKWSLLHSVAHERSEVFCWGVELECFSWAIVQFSGNCRKVFLGVAGELGAFGEVFTKEAVGVLVRATLPWGVRVAEEDGH